MQATVICASRRFIELKLESGEVVSAMAESKAIDIVAGDEVKFQRLGGNYIVKQVYPRLNCLKRSYRRAEKKLAANLDLLLIVAATHPLFNTAFIDRLLVAAFSEKIEAVLILNKIDLDLEGTKAELKTYEDLGIPLLKLSALNGTNIDALSERLSDSKLRKAALAGISGVGKSTILNRLIPGAGSRTAEVSRRTGQGRQTTTQGYAHTLKRSGAEDLLLIDLPGLSNFGVTHLERNEVKLYFPEFRDFSAKCRFRDCSHIKENDCAVKSAVSARKIADSRYRSYIEIVNEIDDTREY